LCRGTLVEDINYLHRTVDMFSILLPEQRKKANSLQMMGITIGADNLMVLNPESVAPSKARRVLVALPSGLLSATQPLFIPLKMCPIIIELEINPLAEQYLDTKDGSTTWSLEDAQVKVDLVTMQPEIACPIYNTNTTSGLEIGFDLQRDAQHGSWSLR